MGRIAGAVAGQAGEPTTPVVVVISRRVKPGCEAAFEEVLRKVGHEAVKFPGHQGFSVLRPNSGQPRAYTIVVHFASGPELDAWTHSEIRQRLLADAEALCIGGMEVQQISGLEGWFQLPGSAVIIAPPRWKMAFVTWIAIFPLLLIFNVFRVPLLVQFPLVLRLVVVSGVTIYLMTYLVMPWATRIFRGWLYPTARRAADRFA